MWEEARAPQENQRLNVIGSLTTKIVVHEY